MSDRTPKRDRAVPTLTEWTGWPGYYARFLADPDIKPIPLCPKQFEGVDPRLATAADSMEHPSYEWLKSVESGYALWFYAEKWGWFVTDYQDYHGKVEAYAACYPRDFAERGRVPLDIVAELQAYLEVEYGSLVRYVGFFFQGKLTGTANGIFVAWDTEDHRLVRLVDAPGDTYYHKIAARFPIEMEGPILAARELETGGVLDLYNDYPCGGILFSPEKTTAAELERRFWIGVFNRKFGRAWWQHPLIHRTILA